MQVEWYGQSAFALRTPEAVVFIDPFGDMSAAAARSMQFDYPPIEGVTADLLLVTHEHGDHNGVEAISGEPETLRSTAGTLSSSIGDVVAVASEHDAAAGTQRGPNTIFVFDLGGLRVAHFGDFGQATLRDEQAAAIGQVDLAFLPVGGGPTIGGTAAAQIARRIGARWAVPMHYRTERIDFLGPVDEFVEQIGGVHRVDGASLFDTDRLPASSGSALAVVPAAP
ncbi:MAG TPA: MBL fold metallo-hydrolase [Solirubrobacteraceae bacterium]|nr:MBL fold metallo-hydrolase [Solirubrobacteraceae bacterium]